MKEEDFKIPPTFCGIATEELIKYLCSEGVRSPWFLGEPRQVAGVFWWDRFNLFIHRVREVDREQEFEHLWESGYYDE